MAKSTGSTAKTVAAASKTSTGAKAALKTAVSAKKSVAKPAAPTKKAAKPAKPAATPVKAAKPAAVAAKAATKGGGKPVAKPPASNGKNVKSAAVAKPAPAVVKTRTAAAPASANVKQATHTIPSAATVAAKPAAAKPAAAVKPEPAVIAAAPVVSATPETPAPSSKPTKLVITEESKKNSRKGVITPTASEAGITMEGGRYALAATTNIDLPPGFRPSSDEEYMNPMHLAFFRNKLRDWRDQLVEESKQTIDNLREEVRDIGDEAERATRETENSLELRTRDRYRKLIAKIDKALKRIEEGRYGYCEETDEDIGLERLEARPIATLCLDAQERWEHRQRQMGD